MSTFTVLRAALRLAKEAGYTKQGRGIWRAALGRFESEGIDAPYWWDAVLSGMGEPRDTGDMFEVSDDERTAFGYADGVTHVVVWQGETGFIYVDQGTEAL
jgi:hypothetical protein